MKIVIKIIAFSLFISLNSLFGQHEKILVHGTFKDLHLEKINIDQIVMMHKGFKKLFDYYGNPLDSTFIEKSSEAIWIFEYEGFELTYIQISPRGPELLKIVVNSPAVKFQMNQNRLFEMNNSDALTSERSYISGKKIKADLDDNRKFEGEIEYLEFDYKDKKLNKITFKRDLQI